MLPFGEWRKPEYPGKNHLWYSREPTVSPQFSSYILERPNAEGTLFAQGDYWQILINYIKNKGGSIPSIIYTASVFPCHNLVCYLISLLSLLLFLVCSRFIHSSYWLHIAWWTMMVK